MLTSFFSCLVFAFYSVFKHSSAALCKKVGNTSWSRPYLTGKYKNIKLFFICWIIIILYTLYWFIVLSTSSRHVSLTYTNNLFALKNCSMKENNYKDIKITEVPYITYLSITKKSSFSSEMTNKVLNIYLNTLLWYLCTCFLDFWHAPLPGAKCNTVFLSLSTSSAALVSLDVHGCL